MNKLYCRTYQAIFRTAAVFMPWRRPERLDSFMAVAAVLASHDVKAVLLVISAGMVRRGQHAELMAALTAHKIRGLIYDKTGQNPTIDNIEEALALYHEGQCTAIIALGGGSPLDCAKGVGARVARPGKTIPQMRGQLKVGKKLPLLVAVPTTAGTGSEVTLAAVVTDSATHEKYGIIDPALVPHYALLEPQLTTSLPPDLTAWTGLDALCHAVEAYIGHSNTKGTRADALKAVELIFANLYTAFCEGENLAARKNMQDAAYYAGLAFTRAYVGNIHAVAHTLGGQYGVQHGLANAVIMPYVLEMYGEKAAKPLAELAAAAGVASPSATGAENAAAFIAAIRALNSKMNIPDKIPALKKEDIPILAGRALREANPLYPVPVVFDREMMEGVYRKI
ncbi:MAG: iron-containing alcohol dehydrogenase [Lachnospiraceae bacterium]|jgi:alcohol dehydrogenase class IV|nr:iron-containing alcohol dehydrogenase [Lachnospiraceae bacterium]